MRVYSMSKMVVLLFFATSINNATVQPIFPGENIWKLVSRIGFTADIIEEKVCALLDAQSCDIAITSVPFTITAPGVYCLANNVVYSGMSTIGIDIQSDCVLLDLKGRTVEGPCEVANDIGINVSGTKNVMIKNGFIKGSGTGIKVDGNPSSGPVKISDIIVTNATTPGNSAAGIVIEDYNVVVVEKCCVSNGAAHGFSIIGTSTHCIFKDCVAWCNANSGFFIDVNSIQNCLLSCKGNLGTSTESTDAGFRIDGDENFAHRSIALGNASHGFLLIGSKNILDECIAINNGVSLKSRLLKDNPSLRSHSLDSHRMGFIITQGQKKNENNILRRCMALANLVDGITVDVSGGHEVLACSTVGNGRYGVSDELNSTNKIFANASNANTIANYFQVDPTMSNPTAATGYWMNVSPINAP